MRYQYRCESCGNTVPAERIEKRIPGTRGQTRIAAVVMCESKAHKEQQEMTREGYMPARREESPHR